jgi:hypothetical protein
VQTGLGRTPSPVVRVPEAVPTRYSVFTTIRLTHPTGWSSDEALRLIFRRCLVPLFVLISVILTEDRFGHLESCRMKSRAFFRSGPLVSNS